MKKALLLILLFIHPLLWSQTPGSYSITHRNYSPSLFSGLDKTKVPSGFLIDQSASIADVSPFNGQALTDSNYVSSFLHALLLQAIITSDVQSRVWDEQYGASTSNDIIPITISLYQFDRIKSTALTDGLLQLTGGTLFDCFDSSGAWINPYEESVLFACSPSVHCSQDVYTLTFIPELTQYQNIPISSFELNPDDGLGFRPLNSGGLTVTYQVDGIKELVFRATTPLGTFYSHSLLQINPTLPLHPTPRTDYSSYQVQTISKQLQDETTISAQLTIAYADSTNQLLKPLIYLDGFDPIDLAPLAGEDLNGFTTIDDNKDLLRRIFPDVDIIFVDWNNSEADIRDNSELLVDILHYVNTQKHNAGSTERNILIGDSMGGLIARYTLRKMELDEDPHECKAYVSNDSPHKGAHVPLGYLYMLNGLLRFIQDMGMSHFKNLSLSSPFLNVIYKYLHSTSAQQMLYNYVDASGTINHSRYQELQNELNSMGLPQGDIGYGIDNIALSNGGPVQLGPSLIDSRHYLVFEATGRTSLGTGEIIDLLLSPLFGIIPTDVLRSLFIPPFFASAAVLNSHLSVSPDRGIASESLCSFSFEHELYRPWLPFPVIDTYSFTYNDPGNIYRIDYCEGSKYSIDNSGNGVQILPSIALDGLVYLDLADRFMFVPTVSSLDLPYNLTESFSVYTNTFTSPFDAYAINQATCATYHTELTERKVTLLSDQINAGIIDGPTICSSTSSHYFLTGVQPIDACWSSSDTTIAIINSNGDLTAKRNGDVLIRLTYNKEGTHFEKKKDVHINAFPANSFVFPKPIPPITLQTGCDEDGMYVEAIADNGYNLNDAQAYSCTWYVKVDDEAMDFIYQYGENKYRCYLGDRPESAQDKILVSLRVSAPMGTSPLYSIIIPFYKEFSLAQPLFILLSPNSGLPIRFSNGSSLQQLTPSTLLILQSSNEEIRPYLRNNARLVIMDNGHQYPNVSSANDKLVFPIFTDPIFSSIFGNWQNIPPSSWPYPLHIQIRALVYEDELLKEYFIPIILNYGQ